MREIIIIGRGKLAQTIVERFQDYSDLPIRAYEPSVPINKETVFVHVGSGRQYKETLESAIKNCCTYIQAATKKSFPLDPPQKGDLRYLYAPNLDLHIIKLFHLFKKSSALFHREKKTITESHQADKTSVPGTAVKFCELLDIPKEEIVSIRDPEKQKELGISRLDHHAYHKMTIGSENSALTFETRIEGAISYVQGLAAIVSGLLSMEKGVFEVEELVERGLI